ncbi:ATP-binding protein [Bacteroidales bacterium OttesenSCG-928-K03]|nr:ATP-binding protein [Odoribacter sp. OttesenSCG-928-L07]MDL2238637.1 ATP-binding protein [Bacteroidales bacterium OttesenSCG-928-L14]MDL2240272.1 ATP-binding protein [Bacteroidales bacterium OttesenSCG-928-K22]MDL2242711.1 ATP-binding protein [Bacteroidales bacterium OttesenSCG-928-K03]
MNPFSYGKIVRGDSFYDRKEELKRIVAILTGGNNMVLYAPRRFGKTSLVFRVIEKMEKEGYICIYFDFMPVFSVESFVRLYSKALAEKQSNLQKFVKLFSSSIKNIRPTLSFDRDGLPEFSIDFVGEKVDETTISELLDLTEKIAGNKRIIVFFDEFQEVEKISKINFEALLRSKIQQQEKTNYLFFGSKTHLLKQMFNDKKKPFYNSATQMSIKGLPEKDTVAYLQKQFSSSNITINEEEAWHIISISSNIPHYIQMLAAEIWQYMINNLCVVTKEIIDTSVDIIVNMKSDYYMELFNRQSNSKKELLQALTQNGKNVFSADYIRKNNLPSASSLQRAVVELVNDGVIERVNDEYFITDPFFKLFVERVT